MSIKRKSLAICAFLAAASGALAEDRAVIVGVNTYPYAKDSDLNYARSDAEKFRDFVKSELGLKDSQIRMLLDRDATTKAVIEAIVQDLLFKTKPGDRAILYFSGHGLQRPDRDNEENDGKDEVIVLSDAGRKGTGFISDDEFRYAFSKIPDRRVLFVVDACHSGTISRALETPGDDLAKTIKLTNIELSEFEPNAFFDIQSLEPESQSRSGSFVPGQAHMDVWSAAAQDQLAWENRQGGVFTRTFIEGVQQRKADRNRNGAVTNAELLQYVRAQSAAYCRSNPKCIASNKGRLTPEFSGQINRQAVLVAAAPQSQAAPAGLPPIVPAPTGAEGNTAQGTGTGQTGATPPQTTEPEPPANTASTTPPDVTDTVTSLSTTPDTSTQTTTVNPDSPVNSGSAPNSTLTGTSVDTAPSVPGSTGTSTTTTQVDPQVAPPPPTPIPGGVLNQTDVLTDLFVPAGDPGFTLELVGGTTLFVDDIISFDVTSEQSGQLILFDYNPDGELFQVFPSRLSDRGVERISSGEAFSIPETFSKNDNPLRIRVTEPVGNGNLVAIFVEDSITEITDLLPDHVSLRPIPDAEAHLIQIAEILSRSVSDDTGPRPSRWSSTVIPYTILE